MKANEVTLNSFLEQNKTQFVIPVYQRNYDWKDTQCKQLFDDILATGNKEDHETHFIGSIVFIHDGVYTSSEVKALVIIDGQQRLTTISLLYLALYRFAVDAGMDAKATELNETFIINKFVSQDDSKLKLKQTDNNAKAFRFILSENDPREYGEYSKVIENFIYFSTRINQDNFTTILSGLKRLLFVEISLERGKDDPQRIFESLNSTGLELSQADLIRNYILMGLDPRKQISVFNTYWEVIETNAKEEIKDESRVSEFIRDYLTLTNNKIPNKKKVYQAFKDKYHERNDNFYSEILNEIKRYSVFYNKLLNPQKEQDISIRKELNYIKRLEINVAFPFLLSIYLDFNKDIISKEEFVEVLQIVQSFTWRRFIASVPTNALNKIFMTLYTEIDKSNYIESLTSALAKKKSTQRWPNNTEIKNHLFEKDIYNIQAKNKSYFFELLENYHNREYVSTDNENITIEHIFPQNPVEEWSILLDADEYKLMKEKYLHTIGNLTLSGNNGSLSNKTFIAKKNMNVDEKEQGYNFSSLWLNRYLREIDEWGVFQLNTRNKLILDRFLKIWHYPDIEDLSSNENEEHKIFNAPDPKGEKLAYYIFMDEKIEESEVSKMYYNILEFLFDDNPNLFFNSDLKDYLPLTTDESSLRAPYQIKDGYFIESNIDNNSKFRRLKAVLAAFDLQEELLIKYR